MMLSCTGSRHNRICAALAIAALTLLSNATATAQTPQNSQRTQGKSVEMAPVIVDGDELFDLRGISSYPAQERAKVVAERIRAVARDETIATSDLRAVKADDRTNIQAGEHRIVSLFDADAEAEQLDERQTLAEIMQNRIAKAIVRYRYERSRDYLLPQAIHAAIVLGVLVALLLALRWLFRWFNRLLERRFHSQIKKLEVKSFRLLSAEELKGAWLGGLRSVHLLVALALIVLGAGYVLSLFPWTRWFALATMTLLSDPLKTMWIGLIEAVPGLAFIAILFFVARYILRLSQLLFSGIAYGTIRPGGFEREWAWPTYRLVRLFVIAFALIIAYPYIPGSESAAFKGVSIFLGLLMSLGATSIVANSLAGYMLIYRRAFRVGDRIKVGDIVGDVVEMRQQLTHLRTLKNEEVTIPSSLILNSNVVNYSSLADAGGLILHTTVGIGYETPWRQVEAMLIEAANRTDGLLREPTPFVLQTALGDFCITYEINAYCDRPQQTPQLYTALHRNILDIFNDHGVQIMTPNYVADTAQPKVVPRSEWYAAPASPPATQPETGDAGTKTDRAERN